MQVKLVKNESGVDEWMIVEMQGSIERGGVPINGEMMGNIGWRKDNSEALLLIGHHLLEGKVSNLEKPFLVTSPVSSDHSLKVEAIIRRRLVFKNRPKPIVAKTLARK